jgi:hypothetical protein
VKISDAQQVIYESRNSLIIYGIAFGNTQTGHNWTQAGASASAASAASAAAPYGPGIRVEQRSGPGVFRHLRYSGRYLAFFLGAEQAGDNIPELHSIHKGSTLSQDSFELCRLNTTRSPRIVGQFLECCHYRRVILPTVELAFRESLRLLVCAES